MSWQLPEEFQTDGGVIRWAQLGAGADPIVLVHGTAYSSFIWRDIAPALAMKRRVFAFDHLGYGKSEKREDQDLTLAAQARRFVQLLDHWGLAEPSVVAHDIGGAIVLRALLLDGAGYRDLTMVDAVSGGRWEGGLFHLIRTRPDVFEQLPEYAYESLVVSHFLNATRLGLRPEVLKAFLAPWRGPAGQAAYYRQYQQLSESDTDPYEADLAEIAVPVKLIWGREDRILPPEHATWLHDRIPHATLHWIADAGHLVQEDAPAQLLAHLLGGFD